MQQQPGDDGGDPHQATKAPNTSREVIRRSQNSGPRGQGMQAVLGQAMQANGNRSAMMSGAAR